MAEAPVQNGERQLSVNTRTGRTPQCCDSTSSLPGEPVPALLRGSYVLPHVEIGSELSRIVFERLTRTLPMWSRMPEAPLRRGGYGAALAIGLRSGKLGGCTGED